MKQMTFEDFLAVRDARDWRLIDVREQDEWDEVHVKGTELFPLSRLRDGAIPETDDRPVALICRSGARSAMAAQILEGAGWAEVINISDGTLGAIATGEEHLERG